MGLFNTTKRIIQTVFVLLLFVLFLNWEEFLKPEINLDSYSAEVLRVVDGDTIDVITDQGIKERVRLLLIDSPESVHPDVEEELFGAEASYFAKQVLEKGKQIRLEIGNPNRDKYERLLAYVWIDDVNFNQLMLEKGYARVAYVYEPNTKYLKEFKKSEAYARRNKLNIWSIKNYVTKDGFDMSILD